MSTVSKEIADRIAAGEFPEDQAVKIVKYTNCFGSEASYGVIFAGDNPDKYRASPFVIDPVVYWETCEGGVHSWSDAQGKLPSTYKCTRCGEPYGDLK